MQANIITKLQDLEKAKEEWNDLLQNIENVEVFYTWEWMDAYLKHVYNQKAQLFIITFQDKGQYVGIVPLCIETKRVGVLPIRILHHIISEPADYSSFYFHKDYNYLQLLKETFQIIFQNKEKWDTIKLLNFNSRNRFIYLIKNMVETEYQYTCVCQQNTITPYFYFNRISSKTHKSRIKAIERKERKLMREHEVKICLHQPWSKEIWDTLVALHREKWMGSVFYQEKYVAFFKELIPLLGRKEQIVFSYFTIDQKIVSIILLFITEKKAYFYMTVYNQEFSDTAAGLILLKHTIEYYQDKKKEFDFLRGNEEYKFYWADAAHMNYDFYIINKNFKSIYVKFYMGVLDLCDSIKQYAQKRKWLKKFYKKIKKQFFTYFKKKSIYGNKEEER